MRLTREMVIPLSLPKGSKSSLQIYLYQEGIPFDRSHHTNYITLVYLPLHFETKSVGLNIKSEALGL
jgi:hypothetical protein